MSKKLKGKFEAERVALWKTSRNQKARAPPNCVGRIRSNLILEVILGVKKAKNAKALKISQLFLAIFGYITGHTVNKIYTIGLNIIIYQCYFIKIALSKKFKWKLSQQQQQQQLLQFHGLGFAADKKRN